MGKIKNCKANAVKAQNCTKLRNVSYEEVYELFENYEDMEDSKIDLGCGVYVQITDQGGIRDVGIETSDGNFSYTVGDFCNDVVYLLSGSENYIDHLTYVLNEYIDLENKVEDGVIG